jgi:splicing factor 3B subunit 3
VLTFYELDLGVNHVVRKWSDAVDFSSHALIAVPGTPDGPGGVLVCNQTSLVYRNQNHPTLSVLFPKRISQNEGTFIVAHSTHKQKVRNAKAINMKSTAGY